MQNSNDNAEPFRSSWKWHILPALGIIAFVSAILINKEFAERWLSPDGHIASTGLAQLTFFRYGLCALAGLFATVWLLRNIISKTWHVTVCRWQSPPDRLSPSDLLPIVRPPTLRTILLLLTPIWLTAIAFSLLIDDTWANRLTHENGPLETATVILYCLSGILFLTQSILSFSRENKTSFRCWWFLLLTLFCLIIAGEETNWGQTYLEYETPELFKQLNVQKDFSLHNIRMPKGIVKPYWANSSSSLLSILGGIVLPLLLLTIQHFRRLIWALDTPLPPWLAQIFLLIAAFIPPDTLIKSQMIRANIPSELREFTISVAFAIWSWSSWKNRVR